MNQSAISKPSRLRRMAREPLPAATNGAEATASPSVLPCEDAPLRPKTKAGMVEDLLIRDKGASLGELCQATGWQPHSARAFLTGLRKKGKALERAKREDETTFYKLVAAEVG